MNATFNKELNRFTRANAHNHDGYLYLTAGNNKCGTLVSYFAENGMSCEIVPNIFLDDDTVNIRVPLTGENALREDVHFLCAKYDNKLGDIDIEKRTSSGNIHAVTYGQLVETATNKLFRLRQKLQDHYDALGQESIVEQALKESKQLKMDV